jgi:hypothetical protein
VSWSVGPCHHNMVHSLFPDWEYGHQVWRVVAKKKKSSRKPPWSGGPLPRWLDEGLITPYHKIINVLRSMTQDFRPRQIRRNDLNTCSLAQAGEKRRGVLNRIRTFGFHKMRGLSLTGWKGNNCPASQYIFRHFSNAKLYTVIAKTSYCAVCWAVPV